MLKMERRRHLRFPLRKRAILTFPATYRDVMLLDISMHGALVEAIDVRGIAVNTKCRFRVLNVAGRQILELGAAVVHCLSGKFAGLEFGNLTLGVEKSLRHLIENSHNTEAPVRSDRCVLLQPSEPIRSPSSIG